ncbi:MAG: ferredoxin [Naasia sp.]|jgi:ferredoxin|uniref:ferredoxin n=1 Tax=Naasia sp. TaxID=2546198 RepID=UPI00260B91E8|nr:ferredoxin [Naasia sp.]MCU1571201.1 ferredoxin [Naasia sp.]
MVKIQVDRTQCQNFGSCVIEAPNVFSLNANDEMEYTPEADDSELDNVEAAVDVCPMQAIALVLRS